MKHLFKSLTILLMLFISSISMNAQTVVLKSGNINIRYGPYTSASILSDYNGRHVHYSKGTTFNYAGETYNGFHSIYVNGQKMWVSTQFSTLRGVRHNNNSYGRNLVINGTNVNFRLRPSLNAGILRSGGRNVHVPKYTRLPYLGTSGSFFKTQYGGKIVYVHMQFAYVE